MTNNNYITDLNTQFKDKVVVITGSTQGMGAETAKLFAARGAKAITICGRNEENGIRVKKEVESFGSKCIFVKAELSEVNDCRNIIASTDQAFGTIHSLVNCAGYTERGTVISTTVDNYEKNFNINTRAPFILMQDSIKIMRRDKIKGTIASVLSMAWYSGMPFLTAYSASKGALAILIKNIANAVVADQIRVNGLSPGWTETPGEHSIQKRVHDGGDDWLEKAEERVPMRRLTKTLDIARGLAFLCSDESGVMTGSVVDYDQSVSGWHSYSVYDASKIDDSLLGE